MISFCSKVEDTVHKEQMDRAERRQRRLNQKAEQPNLGGGTPAGRGRGAGKRQQVQTQSNQHTVNQKKTERKDHQDICSEGESVDGLVQEAGPDMYIKDLERKLSDLKVEIQSLREQLQSSEDSRSKYFHINDKLEKEVKSLKAKLSMLSSPTRLGSLVATEAECARLRSTVRSLGDKNKQLLEDMCEVQRKCNSAFQDILARNNQTNLEPKPRCWRSGAGSDQLNGAHKQPPDGYYQECKKATNDFKNERQYEDGPPPGFDVDVDVDVEIEDNETDYRRRKPEVLRPTRSFSDERMHAFNGDWRTGGEAALKYREQEWERPYYSGTPDLPSGGARDRKDNEGRRQPIYPPLLNAAQMGLAGEYVELTFLSWLNIKVRRPTTAEMVYHQKQHERNGKVSFWKGIPSSELREKFAEYESISPSEIPDDEALDKVLGGILSIGYAISYWMTTKDKLWCLVWKNCTTIEDLPGYVHREVMIRKETKRPRSPTDAGEDHFRERVPFA